MNQPTQPTQQAEQAQQAQPLINGHLQERPVASMQTVFNTGESLPAVTNSKLEMLRDQIATLEMCRTLAHHYANTQMVPKQYQGKPEEAAVAIQWGIEIGIQPLQALQNIATINGSPSLWGDALIAIVRGSGQCDFLTSTWDADTQTATVSTQRKDQPVETRTFSMEDAKTAGLADRQTYKQHGRRMCTARARSHVLRDVYADLLKGFKVREVEQEYKDGYPSEKDITPKKTKSAALEALLNPEPKKEQQVDAATDSEFEALCSMMRASTTKADLKTVSAPIKGWQDASEQEALKSLWFEINSGLEA